jgi:hypothetical protein
MSQQTNITPSVAAPTPVVYDPNNEPSLESEFTSAHRGMHYRQETGGVVTPVRPFHPTKCAFDHTGILSLAAAGRRDAQDFVDALLDVIEDNNGGQRPLPSDLNFLVNTGTPADRENWMLSVKLARPFPARIRLIRARAGAEWEYHIERLSQSLRTRPRSAVVDRPMHPRRRRPEEIGQTGEPELLPPDSADYYDSRPVREGERFLDL